MVQYCPTEMALVSILNKPKQGTPFRKDRAMFMNCPINYDDAVKRTHTRPDLLRFENTSGESHADHIPQWRITSIAHTRYLIRGHQRQTPRPTHCIEACWTKLILQAKFVGPGSYMEMEFHQPHPQLTTWAKICFNKSCHIGQKY